MFSLIGRLRQGCLPREQEWGKDVDRICQGEGSSRAAAGAPGVERKGNRDGGERAGDKEWASMCRVRHPGSQMGKGIGGGEGKGEGRWRGHIRPTRFEVTGGSR